MICIWSSWCHCHPIISCSSKVQNDLPWYRLTQVVLEKRPWNGCSSSSFYNNSVNFHQSLYTKNTVIQGILKRNMHAVWKRCQYSVPEHTVTKTQCSFMSLECWSSSLQMLCCTGAINISHWMKNGLQMGMIRVTWQFLYFGILGPVTSLQWTVDVQFSVQIDIEF